MTHERSESSKPAGTGWLPGVLVALLAGVFLVVGFAIGGPERLDGIVIGVVGFLAAFAIIRRRTSATSTRRD